MLTVKESRKALWGTRWTWRGFTARKRERPSRSLNKPPLKSGSGVELQSDSTDLLSSSSGSARSRLASAHLLDSCERRKCPDWDACAEIWFQTTSSCSDPICTNWISFSMFFLFAVQTSWNPREQKLIWAEIVNTASFIKRISKEKSVRQFIKMAQRPSPESSSPRQSASHHNLTLNTELSFVLSLFANFTVLTGIFRPREDREHTHRRAHTLTHKGRHTDTHTHTHTYTPRGARVQSEGSNQFGQLLC